MKKLIAIGAAAMLAFSLSACSSAGKAETAKSQTAKVQEERQMQTDEKAKQKALGAMTPEAALDYMKAAKNLVIVDVATTNWYNKEHFSGAIHIPIEEIDDAKADAKYREIPKDRPVLLHCRRGMIVPGAYRRVLELRPDIPEIAYIDGRPLFKEYNDWLAAQSALPKQKQLGGLTPEAALEYMKKTPDLVIVQVNTAQWKITPGFDGALWIPHNEMEQRCGEIPKGKPVLLHCGAGIVSVPAYKVLLEKRPDIPEIGYIAGSPHPLIPAYNEWKKTH